MAHRQVSQFRQAEPKVPVYLISVRQRRDLARHIAERTGVRHESPQVLVIRDGQVAASASHDRVTAEFLLSFS
jgi:bacillithiol system protein YtxJ